MQEVYLESYRDNRSESAGLHGLREQLTEAKEGPLAAGEWKERYMCLKEEEGKGAVYSRKSVPEERRGEEGEDKGKRAVSFLLKGSICFPKAET